MKIIVSLLALYLTFSTCLADLGDSKARIMRQNHGSLENPDGYILFFVDGNREGTVAKIGFNKKGESVVELYMAGKNQPFTSSQNDSFKLSNSKLHSLTEITTTHSLSYSDGFQIFNHHFSLNANEKAYTNFSKNLFIIVGPYRMLAFLGEEGARKYKQM